MCTVVQNMMMDIDLSQAKKSECSLRSFFRTCCFFQNEEELPQVWKVCGSLVPDS